MPNSKYRNYPSPDRFPLAVKLQEHESVETDVFHKLDYSELVFVTNGTAEHRIGSQKYPLQRNDILILHPPTEHAYFECRNFEIFTIIFDSRVPVPALEAAGLWIVEQLYPHGISTFDQLQPITQIPDYDHDLCANLVRRLSYETHRNRLGVNVMIPTMFTELVVYLARGKLHEEEKDRLWLLQSPVEYLNSHFREKIDVRKLAKLAGMSERTLFRHFDRMFGMSPNNYLRKIRIQKAEELLRKTHYEINEIAVKCGFCDSSHFCRVFHSVTGETPLQFRSGYQRKDFLARSE